MTLRVKEILSWYGADNVGTLTNLRRLNHGRLASTGKLVIPPSGGATVADDDTLLVEIRAIHAGGGFGSIIGRNSFQRSKREALRLLGAVMDIYAAPTLSAATA